jgi:hypothetical protein
MRKEKKKVVNPSFFQFFVFLVLLFSFGAPGEAGVGREGSVIYILSWEDGGRAMAGLFGAIFLTGLWIGISSFFICSRIGIFKKQRERERNVSGVSM